MVNTPPKDCHTVNTPWCQNHDHLEEDQRSPPSELNVPASESNKNDQDREKDPGNETAEPTESSKKDTDNDTDVGLGSVSTGPSQTSASCGESGGELESRPAGGGSAGGSVGELQGGKSSETEKESDSTKIDPHREEDQRRVESTFVGTVIPEPSPTSASGGKSGGGLGRRPDGGGSEGDKFSETVKVSESSKNDPHREEDQRREISPIVGTVNTGPSQTSGVDEGHRTDNLPENILQKLFNPWSQEDDGSQSTKNQLEGKSSETRKEENVLIPGNKKNIIPSVNNQGPKGKADSEISPQKYEEYLKKLKIINTNEDYDISVRAFKSLSLKIELHRDPYKLDQKTPADDQCFFHCLLQQADREEVYNELPEEFKQVLKTRNVQQIRTYIVENMERNESNKALVAFRKQYIEVASVVHGYPSWKKLCREMRKSHIWADETVVQAAAFLIGMDIGVTSMDCRPGDINIFRKDESTPDADNISYPCLVIGKILG